MKNRGFTLVEILIVIAIIGILASVVLVSLNYSRFRAANVKVLAEVSQIRSSLEQGYVSTGYADLEGTPGNAATLVADGPNRSNLEILICDIAKQNGYPATVDGDLTADCEDQTGLRTGIIIYTNDTGPGVRDYAVYSTTTPGGYVCIDSFGNTVSTSSASIPAYASIVSTSTALCQ